MSGIDVLLVGDLASVHIQRLGAGLAGDDLTVEVAGFGRSPSTGVKIHRLPGATAGSDLKYGVGVLGLLDAIHKSQPSIVHAHYVSSFGLMAAIAVRLARRGGRCPRLVETAWGTDLLVTAKQSRIRRRLAQFTLRSADLATGDSQDLQDEIARLAPGLEYRRFVFGPELARYESRVPKRRVILSTRRLERDMRVDLIVLAFQIARAKGVLDGWRLVIAGSGADEPRLRDLAAGSPEIDFVGHLSAGPLGELLDSSSVFVSVPVSDATSASLLEAMAAGHVAVVNDLPANREWVDRSVGEIVARDPSPEELSEALARAVSRTGRASASPAARDRVRSVSWQHELAALTEAYRELRATDLSPVGG